MALRDSNVLSRINTLNANLEAANISEIQKDSSERLFNVLGGTNNISVDSELYASISNVANASDITGYINREKNNLPNNQIVISYNNYRNGRRLNTKRNAPITNTSVFLNAADGIDRTQNAINDMDNAINGLDTLPDQIKEIRTRLTENHKILNDILDIQQDTRHRGRRVDEINTDITNETGLKNRCENLLSILTDIQNIEQRTEYSDPAHAQHTHYEGLHSNLVTNFNNTRGGITGVSSYSSNGDYSRRRSEVSAAQTTHNNNIRNLEQELKLSEDIGTNRNKLATLRIDVPENLGLSFDTNDTIINRTSLTTRNNVQTEINNITNRLDQLNVLEGQIETLHTRYKDNLDRLNRILNLQNLQQRMNSLHPRELDRRHNEFNTIRRISNENLYLGEGAPGIYEPELQNQNINVGGTLAPIPLNFIHGNLGRGFNGGLRNFEYTICDSTGNPLRNNGGRFELQLGGGQTVNIGGITFDNNAQTMNINNLQINPIEGLTFPLSLKLNVRVRIHDNDTGLYIDHHKPLNLEITRPTLSQADRDNAYQTLVPPMDRRIEAEYSDNYRETLENEAIRRILRENGGNENEINEVYNNETQRNIFIDRVRNILRRHFPLLALNNLQTGFRADMTREDRDVPMQYLLDINSFQNYLRQGISDNLRNYASGVIYNNMNAYHNQILQEFLTFQTDVINDKRDNDDNLRLLQIANQIPQSQPNNMRQRLWRRGSIKNNYTKFFKGRSANLENQTLETEDGEIKYGVKVQVLGVNKIVATIDIDGKDEPEIIEAANHDRLIRGILRRANTKDGEPLNRKLRCNIALSVLKAMVMMSPQRLSREIPNTIFPDARGNDIECDRIDAYIQGGNLRIRGGRVDTATHTRQNVTIFDEASFKTLHDINTLETGVTQLSTQINNIMNATAQEYQNATDNLRESRQLLKYNTKQRLRGGPIKRLWGRMLYGKTNSDFDFDTSVNEAGKNVNISFNGGKFTVTGEFDGQEYSYEAKDLGSILRKKINRNRVFDGIELAMVAAINEEYVKKLRTNNLIKAESFAVADLNEDKTGRVYIFDEEGNLSYLEIEDRGLNPLRNGNAGRIDPNEIPIERIRCNDQERREFFQNPLLAGRLLRCMRRRLALF